MGGDTGGRATARTFGVLVATPDTDARAVAVLALDTDGYDLRFAADGLGALRAIAELRPDLLILGDALGDLESLKVVRSLRAQPETEGMGILLVTSKASPIDAVAAAGAGVDAVIAMPVSSLALLGRVQRIRAARFGA